MSRFRRSQVTATGDVTPTEAYDATPVHTEAIRNFIRFVATRQRRARTSERADALTSEITDARDTVKSLSQHASTNRWSQEIIWSSVFVGFVFDFLLWQDIFTGRFELGALSNAATRASAVVCSLAYAYVCSQLGIAAFLKRASVRRRKSDADTGDPIEQVAFRRAVSRESLYLWSFLFVLLTGVSIVGRFTQEGTVTDHSLLTLVSVAIALVIAVMAYQYHDIYAHDLRVAKSFLGKNEKVVHALQEELDSLDLKMTEMSLMGSLLSCDCGRMTCPVNDIRAQLSLQPITQEEVVSEHHRPIEDDSEVEFVPFADETQKEEPTAELAEENDEVVVLKQLYTNKVETPVTEKAELLAQLAEKTAELERLGVENRYWKDKTRQHKMAYNKNNAFITKLVKTVLDEGKSPSFHRRLVAKHRREWQSLWKVIDSIVANYGDQAPTT